MTAPGDLRWFRRRHKGGAHGQMDNTGFFDPHALPVLQQAFRCFPTSEETSWIEWRDIPTVLEDDPKG